jgi:hypothetical protein
MAALTYDTEIVTPRKSWAGVSDEDKRKAETLRKKPTHNNPRDERRRQNIREFIAVDGEAVSGKCEHADCKCRKFAPVDSHSRASLCKCGHTRNITKTDVGHAHVYVLLSVGDESVENTFGLDIVEIFEFLWSVYQKHKNAIFVGFFLGYDFDQWLKTLPYGRAKYLLTAEGIAKRQRKVHPELGPFPVEYKGWEFDILGKKRLRLRLAGEKGYMYICDAGPFFQSSLLAAIDPAEWDANPIVTDEEYELLRKNKEQRGVAVLDDEMRTYNILENDVLSRLMGTLNEGFTELGIRLSRKQFFGPGQAAQEWMTDVSGLPLRADLDTLMPWEAICDVQETYFGGWFEIFVHGHVPGISYEYDINSAYPYIISTLPCMLHSSWYHRNLRGTIRKVRPQGENGSTDVDAANYERKVKAATNTRSPVYATELPDLAENELRFLYAELEGSDPHIGTMPHRFDGGSIARPSCTTGWYWQHEIQAAKNAGLIDTVKIHEWWTFVRGCDCPPPMAEIADLYEKRRTVGKNTPLGKAIKLLINSIYGKFAQWIGSAKFNNMFYASLITAGTRAMICDAIASHPGGTNAALMVATDGVYFNAKHTELSIDKKKLGWWDESPKINMTLFKPGVYWDESTRDIIREDKGKIPKFKSRGVPAASFAKRILDVDDMFAAWGNEYPPDELWPSVDLAWPFKMVTCAQAIQFGRWNSAGTVSDDASNIQNSNPTKGRTSKMGGEYTFSKREPGYFDGVLYRSRPHEGYRFGDGMPRESNPYRAESPLSDALKEHGITPDGYENTLVSEILGWN